MANRLQYAAPRPIDMFAAGDGEPDETPATTARATATAPPPIRLKTLPIPATASDRKTKGHPPASWR